MLIKNRAHGYLSSGMKKYKNFISTFDCVGSGGLYTSVEDLFLWDQNFYHPKVGSKDLIELIQTSGTLKNSNEKIDYAFALNISRYKGLKTISHGGALGGYRSYMIRFPEQNFSVICLANLNTINAIKLCRQISDIYLADQFKTEKPEDKLQKTKKMIKLSKEELKEKAGIYVRSGSGEIIRVFVKDGKLFSRIRNRNYPLEAVSKAIFHVQDSSPKRVLAFEKPSEGKPFLMHFYQHGRKPKTFLSHKSRKLSSENLMQYTGDYYSEEIQRTFSLALVGSKLHFVHKNAPKTHLSPSIKDNFSIGGLAIHFIRDKEDKITAFALDTVRVKNLRFSKK